jgi:hypothetical protein
VDIPCPRVGRGLEAPNFETPGPPRGATGLPKGAKAGMAGGPSGLKGFICVCGAAGGKPVVGRVTGGNPLNVGAGAPWGLKAAPPTEGPQGFMLGAGAPAGAQPGMELGVAEAGTLGGCQAGAGAGARRAGAGAGTGVKVAFTGASVDTKSENMSRGGGVLVPRRAVGAEGATERDVGGACVTVPLEKVPQSSPNAPEGATVAAAAMTAVGGTAAAAEAKASFPRKSQSLGAGCVERGAAGGGTEEVRSPKKSMAEGGGAGGAEKVG